MVDILKQLESYIFSASDLASMTEWPQDLIDDYLSSDRNELMIASEADQTNANVATNTANIATNIANISTNTTDIAILLEIITTQFQCFKLGTQSTTDSFVDLVGWVEDKNVGGFILDSAAGTIQFATDGQYEISAWVMVVDSSAQGTQLDIRFQIDKGTGFFNVAAAEDKQYAARNSLLDSGSAQINNYQIDILANDLIKIQVQDSGDSGDIETNAARINIRKISNP